MNVDKTHWQFSLATLLASLTWVAIACTAYSSPFAAYYAVLAVFLFAAILFKYGPHSSRTFWFWFALCGFAYSVIGVSLLDTMESTTFWRATRGWLEKKNSGPRHWTPEHYLIICHALIAVCVALAGALLIPLLRKPIPHLQR